MVETISVRDHREPGHFWADNEILDIYYPLIGQAAFIVYMLLGRWAIGKPHCDLSIGQIVEKLGMGDNTVRAAIATLVEHKLISITPRQELRKGKTLHLSNLYTLLAVSKQPPQQTSPAHEIPTAIPEGTAISESTPIPEGTAISATLLKTSDLKEIYINNAHTRKEPETVSTTQSTPQPELFGKLPPDFKLTAELKLRAQEAVPGLNVEHQFKLMCSKAKHRGYTSLDWEAFFISWCLESVTKGYARGSPPPSDKHKEAAPSIQPLPVEQAVDPDFAAEFYASRKQQRGIKP